MMELFVGHGKRMAVHVSVLIPLPMPPAYSKYAGLRAPTSLKRTSSDAAKIAESTLDVAAKGTSANADTTMREDLPTCEGCGLERVPKRRLAVGAEEANRNIPFETGGNPVTLNSKPIQHVFVHVRVNLYFNKWYLVFE